MNWTEIYRDVVKVQVLAIPGTPAAYDPSTAKLCRIIPCPGSYFPCHDDQCEMVWDDEAEGWVDCGCEPRARAVRDQVV